MEIIKALKQHNLVGINQELVRPYIRLRDELSVSSNGLLMRNDLLVIPISLRLILVKYAHEGHMGTNLMKRLLRNISWFPGMDRMVDEEILDCGPCQCNQDTTSTEPILPTTIPAEAWSQVALDFSSRTPTNDYMLIAKCEHARDILAEVSRNMTSESAIKICQRVFNERGIPKSVKTDNGPAFRSREFQEFLKRYNVKHIKITPLNPAANGAAECVMKPMNKVIRTAAAENVSWKDNLRAYLKLYHQVPHKATGFSPNELARQDIRSTLVPIFKKRGDKEEVRRKAIENDERAKALMKKKADEYQNTKHREFSVGQPVLLKWLRSNKHQTLFDQNPYRVERVRGTMVVASRDDHRITRNSKFFKHITEHCHENLMGMLSKTKEKVRKYVHFNDFRPEQVVNADVDRQMIGEPEIENPDVPRDNEQQIEANGDRVQEDQQEEAGIQGQQNQGGRGRPRGQGRRQELQSHNAQAGQEDEVQNPQLEARKRFKGNYKKFNMMYPKDLPGDGGTGSGGIF